MVVRMNFILNMIKQINYLREIIIIICAIFEK